MTIAGDAPSELIQAAYSPDLISRSGELLARRLADHLRKIQRGEGPVLPWVDPRENLRLAQSTLTARFGEAVPTSTAANPAASVPGPAGEFAANPLAAVPVESLDQLVARFSELMELVLARSHNLHHPHYVGHQVPAPVPIAGLFDGLGAVLNNPMAIYEMGPWTTSVEQAMLRELGSCLGWSDLDYGGIVTHGASLANLTAMLVARNIRLGDSWEQGVPRQGPPPVLITHCESHYCLARTAGILGLGTRQVIQIGLDHKRRMKIDELEQRLRECRERGQPVIAVAASACATPVGAFDPLRPIAELCREYGVWMHVDAAHGGAAVLSPRFRSLVDGIELADSVTWDAHKMLFVPALCAFLFFRRKANSYQGFRQSAPYLFDPAAPELIDFDGGLRTVECTKRGMVLGLWGVWSMFGRTLFQELVERTFDLGRRLYEKLCEAPDFVPLHEPECNIVVFRHIPAALSAAPPQVVSEFQMQLRRTVCQSGQFYLVPASIDGQSALRCTLINPLTTVADLDALLATLRETGQQILKQSILKPSTAN